MTEPFRIDEITVTEFGVLIFLDGEERYFLVPIDNPIRQVARSMLDTTLSKLSVLDGQADLERYEPSQLYTSDEKLTLQLNEDLCEKVRIFYFTENITVDATSVANPENIKYYYFIFRDNNNNKLLAARRAAQFKGILKARKRLIRLVADTLTITEEPIFKLDDDFDWVVFDQKVNILHPVGFENFAGIDQIILDNARDKAIKLHELIPFLDTTRLSEFVASSKRGARLIASIYTQEGLNCIAQSRLVKECKKNGIELENINGLIGPIAGFEKGFLELLDRRRYQVELVNRSPERYEAPNRKRIAPADS